MHSVRAQFSTGQEGEIRKAECLNIKEKIEIRIRVRAKRLH